MAYYRAHYPEATVIPKMHLLEEHMVPWLRRWHIATGLMGEQGAESLHVHLHKLENRFSGVVNDLDHLQYVVREHNVQAAPELAEMAEAITKLNFIHTQHTRTCTHSLPRHVQRLDTHEATTTCNNYTLNDIPYC